MNPHLSTDQLLSEHFTIHSFFISNQDLIVKNAIRLLKAELIHQVVYRLTSFYLCCRYVIGHTTYLCLLYSTNTTPRCLSLLCSA